MGYGYGAWAPYVSVAERRKKAEKLAAKAKKAGQEMTPIEPYRGAIAKTFWGKAWCDNLEHYSDYANRLPRGRTYVRNGSVIDLRIGAGEVRAQVMGSSLYTVDVNVAKLAEKHWQAIGSACAGSIDSLVELLQGKLSSAVMARVCQPGTGLFPAPKEIKFHCSCPDSAALCKHVAAVLYGVGARLDAEPELLFSLRQVDAKELVAQAGAGLPKTKKAPPKSRVLADSDLADVFGIELGESAPAAKPVTARQKAAGSKTAESATRPTAEKPAKTKTKTVAATAKPAATSKPASPRQTPAPKLLKANAATKTSATAQPTTARAAALGKTKLAATPKAVQTQPAAKPKTVTSSTSKTRKPAAR